MIEKLKPQEIREMVWLDHLPTIDRLAKTLGIKPTRVLNEFNNRSVYNKALYSQLNLAETREMVKTLAGKWAVISNNRAALRVFQAETDGSNRESHWQKRAAYWLGEAARHYGMKDPVSLETAAVLADMAVGQILAGPPNDEPPDGSNLDPPAGSAAGRGRLETLIRSDLLDKDALDNRPKWFELASTFQFPGWGELFPAELFWLSELHRLRNSIIHESSDSYEKDLRSTAYLGLFLAFALAVQKGIPLPVETDSIQAFLAATFRADEETWRRFVSYFSAPARLLINIFFELEITAQVNLDGRYGALNKQGQVFIPDLIFSDLFGRSYTAQVEFPGSVNAVTAQLWAENDVSVVFLPLGYLAQASYYAGLVGFPKERLLPHIGFGPEND